MPLTISLVSSDASSIVVRVPFNSDPDVTDIVFYRNELSDNISGFNRIFSTPNLESPSGFVTATIPIVDLHLDDTTRSFFIRAVEFRNGSESVLTSAPSLSISLPSDIVVSGGFGSSEDDRIASVMYGMDPSSGNFVPINVSPDGSGGFAIESTASITGSVTGTFNLSGDDSDLDSGAGSDPHDVVSIGVPGSGGHNVAGTDSVPLVVSNQSVTMQPGVSVTAGPVAVTALAANASRRFAIFVNTGNETLWLGIGFTPSAGVGIPLLPGNGTYIIDQLNKSSQLVEVISSGGSGKTLFVQEGT